MRTMTAAFALLALAGCRVDIHADLYSSDIIAAVEGEELTTPVVFGIGLPRCDENAPPLTAALETVVPNIEYIGCERDDFDTLAKYRVPAAILDATDPSAMSDDMIGLFSIVVAKREGAYRIGSLWSSQAAQDVWNALPESLIEYKRFDPQPDLRATFNNDLRETIEIGTEDLFLDGKPIPDTTSHTLDRRGQVDLQLSDVSNESFRREGFARFVQFAIPSENTGASGQ